jgi:hypothetical protein
MTETIKIEDFFGASNHKLTIRNIFAIYHHRWDIIGESIQNAVDSILKRAEDAPVGYVPSIEITYNARVRSIEVEDNGIGIPSEEIKRIVAPHVSLKSPKEANRGEFGVGLTFVAFCSNDFRLESISRNTKASLGIKNGYSWTMDENSKEDIQILFDSETITIPDSYTKVFMKPIRFPEYTLPQLEYVLRRYTAVGDFWSCYKEENGPIKVTLTYIDENGHREERQVLNRFWHPADFLAKIEVETVDYTTVDKELKKGKEDALPNWIGFGLTDKDTIIERGKEFTYYALFCRTSYYKQLAEQIGLFIPSEEDEEIAEPIFPQPGVESLNSGIFASKKGMPLGAIVDHPRTAQAGYWRGIFIMMNCDAWRTEPGRKKLHVDDEQIAGVVAKKIFYRLTKFSHYIIPRDPDEEVQSLLRNVDKNIESVRQHRKNHPLINPRNKIIINTEPVNEQTLIGLFHEIIGAGLLLGYRVLKLSAAETYDGIYEYEIPKGYVGKEHWEEWLRGFTAKERNKIEEAGSYRVDEMIVEFKKNLEDIIKDFLQKTKYHHHIKLIVAWDANRDSIKRRGWLLEDLPQSKQKFYGAKWRLRPSAEGQTRGILATDVLLLKDFLCTPNEK